VSDQSPPSAPIRPQTRDNFEIAIICALTLEADAVEALFDHRWDDEGRPYDKAPGDPNAYSTGAIGRHNVVLAHMPGMGKANAATVATNCRVSFPNIKLALVVGVCGVIPRKPDGSEIVLGDVIISDGVVQYDFGRQLPEGFVRKDTLLDSLGRPNIEIRALLGKLKGIQGRKSLRDRMAGYMTVLRSEPELSAEYPGIARDKLFDPAYRHITDQKTCDECGCNGPGVSRSRLEQGNPQSTVHFGLIASGDTVMKSGEERDIIAKQDGIIGFEMESAGVWDCFPCIVIKGACDYADSHKTKVWQRYAAATAAACMKAFLFHLVPSLSSPPGV
jgi:nucleoside phosphorylase